MSDLHDLPLFGGPLAGPPAPPKPKRPAKAKPARPASLPPVQPQAASNIVAFPLCANVQVVMRLADTFLRLRAKHGRRCRELLVQQHFRPLEDRLRRLGVSPDNIQAEVECLEAAIAEVIEIIEGQPSTGGHAA